MSSPTTPALFQPIQVGDVKLRHRVVLAPMTRFRNDAAYVPTDLVVEHYEQRASVPGTLLITEATYPVPQASGEAHTPGLWSTEQLSAWKKVTDAVHAKGSYIFVQLWALGRVARPELLRKEFPDVPHVAPSPIALSTHPENVPREMTKKEIKELVQAHAKAAADSVNIAGFDGIEIHGAHGYLVDQFLQDMSNKRTDEYGGSIENRARFALEIMDAVVAAIGPTKCAIRLSPWCIYQDMRMDDPLPTFTYLVEQLKKRYSNLAYIHVVSPNAALAKGPEDASQNDFIYKLWTPGTVITTGGYTRETGIKTAEETGQLIGYGMAFIANPDLPFRLEKNIELNAVDSATIYTVLEPKGYNDYPFSREFLEAGARDI